MKTILHILGEAVAGADNIQNFSGKLAPMFVHLNDDVLFGEVWNEEAIDV